MKEMTNERKAFRERVCAEYRSDLEKLKNERMYWANRLEKAHYREDIVYSHEMLKETDNSINEMKRRISRWSKDPTTTIVKQYKKTEKPKYTNKF